jgi:hypothetical protein
LQRRPRINSTTVFLKENKMSLIPTSTAIVQSFAGAMYGKQLGSVTLAAVNRDIDNLGINSTLNAYFNYSFKSLTATEVATRVVTNLGITEGADNGIAYVVGVLAGKAANIWGQTISEILAAFSSMTADATYGAAATAWNSKVEAAASYTGAADVGVGTVVSTFTLTISLVSPSGLANTSARPQHSALTPVRCAECGLFA